MRLFLIALGAAPLGWLLAGPLLAWGDRLLVGGMAPPPTLPSLHGNPAPPWEGSGGRAVPPAWRWTLRAGLALLAPLAVWHAATLPAGRLPVLVVAPALLAGVAALALIAALDGAAHLIFAETLALPVALGVLHALSGGGAAWGALLVGGLVCGGLLGLIYLAGQLCYGTDALGWGDVQLGAALGALLGGQGGLRAILWGFILLALVAVVLLAARRISRHTYLPLGVFLALGALLVLLTQPISY
jgi:leader peptidase (prepilin peptidase)/N-methyltransferase